MLILQRHLGFKDLIPNSGKWKVCADEFSECWYCSQHILTLFIWKPRISELASVKDESIKRYYNDALELIHDVDPDFVPMKAGDRPHILGPFNNWKYQPMREMIPFVRKYDKDPPNFLQMAVEQDLIREECLPGPNHKNLTPEEKKVIEEVTNKYYAENWHRLILKHIRFTNPNIANAQALS